MVPSWQTQPFERYDILCFRKHGWGTNELDCGNRSVIPKIKEASLERWP